jgi:hypothetical protein
MTLTQEELAAVFGDSQNQKAEDGTIRASAWMGGARAVVSPMPVEEKRERALALGVPPLGSGLVGEWSDEQASRVLVVPFTDESLDSHGTAFDSDGWDFTRFDKNPIVDWSHNSSEMPIGLVLKREAVSVRGIDGIERKGWQAHVLFSPAELSQDAELAYRNWMAGRLRGASVMFRPVEVERATAEDVERMSLPSEDAYIIRKAELLNFGIVPLPSNANAVQRTAEALALGHAGLVTQAEARSLYGEDAVDAVADWEFPDATVAVSEEVLERVAHVLDSEADVGEVSDELQTAIDESIRLLVYTQISDLTLEVANLRTEIENLRSKAAQEIEGEGRGSEGDNADSDSLYAELLSLRSQIRN